MCTLGVIDTCSLQSSPTEGKPVQPQFLSSDKADAESHLQAGQGQEASVPQTLRPHRAGGANPVRVWIGNSNFPSEERKAAYGEKAKKYNSREIL